MVKNPKRKEKKNEKTKSKNIKRKEKKNEKTKSKNIVKSTPSFKHMTAQRW